MYTYKNKNEELSKVIAAKDNYIQSLIDKISLNDELLQSLNKKDIDVSEENIKIKKINEMLFSKIEKAIEREAIVLRKVEDLQTK